jgi:hypothetical protein
MGLLEKIRDRWINFVSPPVTGDKVGIKKYEMGTLYYPSVVDTDEEKYDAVFDAAQLLDKEIKVRKPKSKSKSKTKSK